MIFRRTCRPARQARRRDTGRHVDERPADVLVPIEAHEVTDVGREAGAGEEPPLAALHTPVLVPVKLTWSGSGVVPTVPTGVAVSVASLLDHTKLKTPSVRGVVR